MDKKEFIELLSQINNIPKCKAEQYLDYTLNGIHEVLNRKECLKLRGFGELGMKMVNPRRYKDPRNGKTSISKSYWTPYCKLSDTFRDLS